MNRFSRLFASSALALAACGVASATPITAGQTVTAAPINYNVTVLQSHIVGQAFTSQAPAGQASTYSGNYGAGVFTDSTNTLCGSAGNCLTFGITVTNNTSSKDGIETVTTGAFGSNFAYNVGYAANGNGSVAPLYIGLNSQGVFSFNFTTMNNLSTAVQPGQTSAYLIIQTSATSFAPGSISFQDQQTATVAGYQPNGSVAVTPEPSSLVLLGTGFIGAATTMLRRRKISA